MGCFLIGQVHHESQNSHKKFSKSWNFVPTRTIIIIAVLRAGLSVLAKNQEHQPHYNICNILILFLFPIKACE